MKRTRAILSAAAMLIVALASAQNETTAITATGGRAEKADLAKQRAAAYAAALELDERTEMSLAKIFMEGGKEVAPLQEQRDALDAQIKAMWAPLDAQAEGMLNEEQAEKLKRMKEAGTFDADACAAPKAGCAKGGAAAGCCAGKAGAKAEMKGSGKAGTGTVEKGGKGTAAPVKPNATMN